MTQIAGSTILLTGVTGGIGHALARELTDRGADLILTGRRADALEAAAAEFGARAVLADLSVAEDVDRLAEECAGTDILISNAALPASGELLDYTQEQIDRALAVNLRAPIALARLLAPHMVKSGGGHIALVGSISGKATTPSSSLYSATKFGLRGFALGFRQDLHGTGVGVSIVQPGFVRDAGMFAVTGATPPAGIRTVTPAAVVKGVIRSIERDVAEVNVAPVALRALSAFAGQFPGFAEKVTRKSGADDTVRQLVEGQKDRR